MTDRGCASQVADALMIPRVFHRIWLGRKPMPEEFRAYGAAWTRLHPGWEIRLWDERSLFRLANQASFERSRSLAQKADIARFEVLHRNGGVYIDCDFEPLKNIECLLLGVSAFVGTEDGRWLSTGIMGCVPDHPLLAALVEDVPRSIATRPDAPVNDQTGPGFLTRVVEERADVPPLRVLGPEIFYPYLYDEPHRRHDRFPGAYAVHHWAGSWRERPSLPRRFARKARKLTRILRAGGT